MIIFSEYRDKAGIGSEQEFDTVEAAIKYAEDRWYGMCDVDKKSYRDDPAGQFCVTVDDDVAFDAIEQDRIERIVEECVDFLDSQDADKEDETGERLTDDELMETALRFVRNYGRGLPEDKRREMAGTSVKRFKEA